MKIYIVTSGCYDDYGIDKIFLTEEKAISFINTICKDNSYKDYTIEEHDTADDITNDDTHTIGVKAVFNDKDELVYFFIVANSMTPRVSIESDKYVIDVIEKYNSESLDEFKTRAKAICKNKYFYHKMKQIKDPTEQLIYQQKHNIYIIE